MHSELKKDKYGGQWLEVSYNNQLSNWNECIAEATRRHNVSLEVPIICIADDARFSLAERTGKARRDTYRAPTTGFQHERGAQEGPSTKGALMPFGTHKGKPVADLPGAYLKWLSTIAQGGLADTVKAVLAERSNGLKTGNRWETGRESSSKPPLMERQIGLNYMYSNNNAV